MKKFTKVIKMVFIIFVGGFFGLLFLFSISYKNDDVVKEKNEIVVKENEVNKNEVVKEKSENIKAGAGAEKVVVDGAGEEEEKEKAIDPKIKKDMIVYYFSVMEGREKNISNKLTILIEQMQNGDVEYINTYSEVVKLLKSGKNYFYTQVDAEEGFNGDEIGKRIDKIGENMGTIQYLREQMLEKLIDGDISKISEYSSDIAYLQSEVEKEKNKIKEEYGIE